MQELKEGFRYFCKCFEAGNSCTGIFVSESNRFQVELFSFDECPNLTDGSPITILLENGLWVQLRDNLIITPSSHGVSSPNVQFFGLHIEANVALIGFSKPPLEPKFTCAHFGFKESQSIFREQLKEHRKVAQLDKFAETNILEMKFAGHDLKITATVSNQKLIAGHQLLFKDTLNVTEGMELVQDYNRFYLLAYGTVINFDYVHLEERNVAEDTIHRWRYVTKPDRSRPANDFLSLGLSIFDFSKSEGQEFYKKSLEKWHDGPVSWKDCAAFLGRSFELSGLLSPERLINACSCFDNLPYPKIELITQAKFKCIRAAVKTVLESHLPAESVEQKDDRSQRIEAALSNFQFLKKETRPTRISTILVHVREKLGPASIANFTEQLVSKAFTIRGKAAHEIFDPTHDELVGVDHAIRSTEAVCLLFFYAWLDIPKDAIAQYKSTKLMREYYLASVHFPHATTERS
jgi:hypothetical protein